MFEKHNYWLREFAFDASRNRTFDEDFYTLDSNVNTVFLHVFVMTIKAEKNRARVALPYLGKCIFGRCKTFLDINIRL